MSLRSLHKHRLRVGLLAALLATTIAGLFAVARGQTTMPTHCHIFDRVEVCGDRINDAIPTDLIEVEGKILTIGLAGQPPLLLVRPPSKMTLPIEKEHASFSYFPRASLDRLGAIFGDIEFINDPQRQTLVGPQPIGTGAGGDMFVNTETGMIANASVPLDEKFRNQKLSMDFLKASGLRRLYFQADLAEMSDFDLAIDLQKRQFTATLPVSNQSAIFGRKREFPDNAEIKISVLIDEFGEGDTRIAAFKVRLFGFVGEVTGTRVIRFFTGPGNPGPLAVEDEAPASFEAERISFFRADNPGMPGLDTTNQQLLFSLQGLQYIDGRFKLRGGSVGIPNWSFGSAFTLANQQAGIVENDQAKTTQLVISSTLTFPSGSVGTDARAFPMSIRVTGRELPDGTSTAAMTGTLLTAARPALNIGPLSVSTPAKTELVFDPAANFFGLKADQVTLRWNAAMGNGSGVQTGFKLGMDKDRKLVFGLGAGGAINLPQVRNKAFTMQLSAGVTSANDTTTFLITGKAQLALPGNGGVAPGVTMFIRSGKNVRDVCTTAIPGCLKRFEYRLSSFELSLGGFGIGLTNAQGTADGGFAVEKATLKVPVGIKSVGGSISGFKVTGNGDVSITGGSVELPPMQVGSFSLVGVKGTFVKNLTGYEFKGAGTVPLPGLDPSGGPAGKRISGEVTVRTRFDASFQGFGVAVDFNTGSPGIPIGTTGMELVGLRGSFDVNANTVKIGVGLRAASVLKVATFPAATVDANAQLQLNPFQLTANARLSVVVFNVAQASMGIGHQQGFAGGPGLNVSFTVDMTFVQGGASLRIGEVTLSNGQKKTAVAASAFLKVGIQKNQIARFIPPVNVNFASVEFTGGHFRVRGNNTTIGLMGRVKVNMPLFVPDVRLSIFVDMNGPRVDVTDTDDYTLIEAAAVRARAAQGVAGYSTRTLSGDETRSLNLLAGATAQQETIPITLDHGGMALFGISYPAGSPSLRLQMPDGTTLTEQTVDGQRSGFLRNTGALTEEHQLAFILSDARPGAYSLIVDNAPAEYHKVSYRFNAEPALAEVAASCGGAPVAGVAVMCDGAAAGGQATVTWRASDADSADATVSVGYVPAPADGSAPDMGGLTTLAEGLPLGQGSFTWELGEVPTGSYRLVVRASDGKSVPVDVVAATTISVDDKRAPAPPANLKAEPLPGELLVTWQPSAERDLAGYEIGFGVVQPGVADSPDAFVYSRDMGAKQVVITASGVLDARLWGLEDDVEVFVGLRAYDLSGNAGEWSPLLRAKPWALAPEAWTPAPNGSLVMAGAVEVAFASPLGLDVEQPLPGELLTLLRADGTAVAGRLEALLNLEGDAAVGLRFVPETALRGGERYTAVVKGGAGGISSADGRQMALDYRWSFVAENQSVFLPLVGR